ncbi:MAG: FAD-dependent oxidoreductase [Oscillospiraceae bacterium]
MTKFWTKYIDVNTNEKLNKSICVDTVVIGGGIAGVLTAYMLKQKNINVVLLEANEIGSGQTGGSTGKITVQHGLIYDKLIKTLGLENAKLYAEANNLALKKFEDIITKNRVDCDFKTISTYLYSTQCKKKLEDEYLAYNKIGIKGKIKKDTTLPFGVKTLLEAENQAQFNPIKFLNFLCKNLDIYQHTFVKNIYQNKVITTHGVVNAKNIVIATHYPFINFPGYYFLKMSQERGYVIALKNADNLHNAYLGADTEALTFRNYENLLFIGGYNHRCGKVDNNYIYKDLINLSKKYYKNSEVVEKWSAQDCITLDGIPYIGKFSNKTDNIYVITGFNKWGMTSSMVAATMISDMISGKKNKYEDLFSPKRFKFKTSYKNMSSNFSAISTSIFPYYMLNKSKKIQQLKPLESDIITYKRKKIGAFKDENNKVFLVNLKCPHLGCFLNWNENELSWDCPCHGSRFNYKGEILDNPTLEGIKYE